MQQNKLILMRGIPGGGKSTRAKQIAQEFIASGGRSVAICSTDDYHMVDGEYVFQPHNLKQFHQANQLRVMALCQLGIQLVIIDNTNIKRRDMHTYISNAQAYGYQVEEIIVGREFLIPSMDMNPHTFMGYVEECAARNTHGVPKDAIERMARNFEE